jgi:hypothetical protein
MELRRIWESLEAILIHITKLMPSRIRIMTTFRMKRMEMMLIKRKKRRILGQLGILQSSFKMDRISTSKSHITQTCLSMFWIWIYLALL